MWGAVVEEQQRQRVRQRRWQPVLEPDRVFSVVETCPLLSSRIACEREKESGVSAERRAKSGLPRDIHIARTEQPARAKVR